MGLTHGHADTNRLVAKNKAMAETGVEVTGRQRKGVAARKTGKSVRDDIVGDIADEIPGSVTEDVVEVKPTGFMRKRAQKVTVLDPFVDLGHGRLAVNMGQRVGAEEPLRPVPPLAPGRKDGEARAFQRSAILDIALRSVEIHGAKGLQPEKIAATAPGGSVTSQSMRRAFKDQLDDIEEHGERTLREVIEQELIDAQLRAFDRWTKQWTLSRTEAVKKLSDVDAEQEMIDGICLIARELIDNKALATLRREDQGLLDAFLAYNQRAQGLVASLARLADACFGFQQTTKRSSATDQRPSRDAIAEFLALNLGLLADEVSLVLLATQDGAKSFVEHLRSYTPTDAR